MAFRALLFLVLAPAVAADTPDVPASDWCAWIPMRALEFVSDCQGNRTVTSQVPTTHTTQGCADWCLWVPGPSWKSIELCYMCAAIAAPPANASSNASANASAANVTEAAHHAQAEAIGEPKPESAPTSLRGKSLFSYPSWCSTIPWGSLQYVPDCRGYRGSGNAVYYGPSCTSWCQWVPSPSWQYVSSCLGCAGQPRPLGGPAGPYGAGCANWCQWVPMGSWQYTSGCSGCF